MISQKSLLSKAIAAFKNGIVFIPLNIDEYYQFSVMPGSNMPY